MDERTYEQRVAEDLARTAALDVAAILWKRSRDHRHNAVDRMRTADQLNALVAEHQINWVELMAHVRMVA